MKTFVSLFISSGTFGLIIGIVYWFSSHDPAGTFLLGFMTIGFAWAALYSFVAEKNSHLAGDLKKVDHAELAGEDLCIVTKGTPWPPVLAFSILVFVVGVVWSDFLLGAGLVCMLLSLWRLGAESARTGYRREMTKEGEQTVT